ncbi:DUF7154 domain-containing protein [Caenorhabditis elegans]|uniref:DUF7154 domain-containing protein n=1 Tax=Caenorhabditis elegans TaxID=6239 RepID=G4SMX8_CAEEL|nr:CUB_2 domain-containing protein [Caenorhabditis elegans]CCD72724.1 CUB_2 domain-containing protein [Caenorhabditis elegans]|eukprot:NP_001255257.1 Uncharacterized protein CELE_K08D10.14 [Caenorhabditis elegans]
MVHVISSNTPSGGSQPLTLYDLSSKTNGLTDFRNDDQFYDSAIGGEGLFLPIALYSANPLVSGKGSIVLPPLLVTYPYGGSFAVTVQNHGPIDTFQSFHLSWYNASSTSNDGFYGYPGSPSYEKNGTIRTDGSYLSAAIYNMTLEYSYSDNTPIKLQIRQYVYIGIAYWPPYAD